MNNHYITLNSQQNLIEGVVIRKLIVHSDQSGSLFETLRNNWKDVYNQKDLAFAMQYMSVTPPGKIRDENRWHIHQYQIDRFICVSGKIVTALHDPRPKSKTNGQLNLFLMGPQNKDEMYILVIPNEVFHGFMVVSNDPGYLLNFPTKLYDPKDEGRIPNHQFDWQTVRQDFSL